ncbi:hypothetical protein [Pseudorhodoferax sp. Leaf267]|uniref:hypothetical protein n=1 Tax=Pseudorhodoferax sp. Leaf267 TaxID=1736316 RepID=UPI0006FED9D5|nr:hypothetical protein [Pseudorhodoferax sp. Leaf267]KQP23247.1 hypothetical protein ASF43_05085 [Pseudorhodoferax sp. Leaf267]
MTDRSTARQPRSDAGKATAEHGVVILEGPDGLAVTMTPEAAARTADSLHVAARQARTQGLDSTFRPTPDDDEIH